MNDKPVAIALPPVAFEYHLTLSVAAWADNVNEPAPQRVAEINVSAFGLL